VNGGFSEICVIRGSILPGGISTERKIGTTDRTDLHRCSSRAWILPSANGFRLFQAQPEAINMLLDRLKAAFA
jgi:hypothetical protein